MEISVKHIARIKQGIGLAMFLVAFSIIRKKFVDSPAMGQGIFTAVFSGDAAVGLIFGAFVLSGFLIAKVGNLNQSCWVI